MPLRKIIFLNYYGKLPQYASYFFSSCKKNPSYHFVIFNDKIENAQDQNIQFIKSTLHDFNVQATGALGIPINLSWAFKICDLRPAYGAIYKELIQGFDFWGFCDLDIILGDLDQFLPDESLEKIDVYSSKPLWNSGSFSLYRNTDVVNTLFRATEDWKTIFTTPRYFGFDECVQRWNGKPIKISEQTNELLSIYDLVHNDNRIQSMYDDSVIEWPKDIVKMCWSNGKWMDLQTSKPFMYFHLLLMKNSWRFYQPQLSFSKEIYVTKLGVSDTDHTKISIASLVWRLKRSFSCFLGIIKSLKKQGLKRVMEKSSLNFFDRCQSYRKQL